MSYRVKMFLPLVGMLLLCGYAAFAVIRSGNKVQEVKNAMDPFADILDRVLKGK